MKTYISILLILNLFSLKYFQCEAQSRTGISKNKAKSAAVSTKKINHSTSAKRDTLIFVPANEKYNKDLWWIIKKGNWGILDANKKVLVPPIYDIPAIDGSMNTSNDECGYEIPNPLIFCTKDNGSVLIDLKKGIISPPGTREIRSHGDRYLFELQNGHFGFIEKSGKISFPPISLIEPHLTYDSLWLIQLGDKYALSSKTGKIIVDSGQMTEEHYKKIIMNLYYKNDTINNADPEKHFSADTAINKEELYLIIKNLFNPMPSIHTGGYLSIQPDVCNIGICFRDLDALLENKEPETCWALERPEDMMSEDKANEVNKIENNIIEIKRTIVTSGHGQGGERSSFEYYKLKKDSLIRIDYSDNLFTQPDTAYGLLTKFIKEVQDTLKSENRLDMDFKFPQLNKRIVQESYEFSFDTLGITCWIPLWNMGEYQIPVRIPNDIIKDYVLPKGLIWEIMHAKQ